MSKESMERNMITYEEFLEMPQREVLALEADFIKDIPDNMRDEMNKRYIKHGRVRWKKLFEDCGDRLPLMKNPVPDWDYMERYIDNIERVVIKNIAKPKAELIKAIKAADPHDIFTEPSIDNMIEMVKSNG